MYKTKRKRGVVLTSTGIKRLQSAIRSVEIVENKGKHLSLEEISSRINVSSRTLSKLWSLSESVDQKTIKLCFSAFNLELHSGDYTIPNKANETETSDLLSIANIEEDSSQPSELTSFIEEHHTQTKQIENLWSYPDGPVPLDSHFYIERPPLEKKVYREITTNGCVIRIRSPKQMGKSSFVLRLCAFAQKLGYQTVNLNCCQLERECLTDLNKLLRCLCWKIATGLGIDANLKEKWNEEIGYNLSSGFYLENYLLELCQNPVVLVLNEVDRFFEYPKICQEFFVLLRSWCEEARHNPNWQKLRLVMVYSTEEYISMDINLSPFNIGLPIRLNDFTQPQVEDLARRYRLDSFKAKDFAQLMSLVGGHPALIQISFYHICSQEMTLQEIIEDAVANGGIYRYHLRRHWIKLQENPRLAKVYAEILAGKQDISFNLIDTYKLEGLGLIRFEGDRVLPRYGLYQSYFAKQLLTVV
ncbi:AAA-like domain-containing protein [Nostoc flagelliforme FACHB-838]|uniref:AAA-like domain-containing protein n=1 Tax=Nostoc flagelliforme FACHB-838 TaxID=2692904 RepID=A0ABR8DYR8_9NOSO|nr:AAA-like domain-containing protein [Nostoc flagelliforme]MBD2534501.1 AAA-like domain-containing protein [Nostoc flagelliforme FACHB-838]